MPPANAQNTSRKKVLYITYMIVQGEVIMKYFLNKKMQADINTKLKMGLPYKHDCAMIIKCPVDVTNETIICPTLKYNRCIRRWWVQEISLRETRWLHECYEDSLKRIHSWRQEFCGHSQDASIFQYANFHYNICGCWGVLHHGLTAA